ATYAMRDSLELLREMGEAITQVRVSGGGARSALWRQIQADIYGQDVVTINAGEGPAFGAAILALVGTGAYGSVAEACEATIQVVETTKLNPATKALHDRGHAIYRQLYQDLKATFRAITAFTGN